MVQLKQGWWMFEDLTWPLRWVREMWLPNMLRLVLAVHVGTGDTSLCMNIKTFKGTSKLHFMRLSFLVIILFTAGLSKPAFPIYSVRKQFFSLYAFSLLSIFLVFWIWCHLYRLHNICIIIVCIGTTYSANFFFLLLFVKIR